MFTTTIENPDRLLVAFLADDKRAGLPWEPEQFAHTVHLVARETGAGRAWATGVIDLTPAFRDAYEDRRGHVAHLNADLLDDAPDDHFQGMGDLISQPGF